MSDLTFLQPQKVDPYKANVSFVGGSMDGKVKEATIHAKMEGVVITLKNKECYKFEEPLTMRFIGIQQPTEILERKLSWKQRAFSKIVKWFNA
jgi:hypothetical protein